MYKDQVNADLLDDRPEVPGSDGRPDGVSVSRAEPRKVGTLNENITRVNESLAVWLTKAFGTMWLCYGFMIYGLLPLFAVFRPHEAAFLYWSNWIQLWALPLILVGTNILGRSAEQRAQIDHEKLAEAYAEQQQVYTEVLALLKKQEEMMQDMLRQDAVLKAQDAVLAEQTAIIKEERPYVERDRVE
jgi:hypothetical protein